MRILTFSAYFTPEIAASMYLTEDMLEGMAKAGHYVEMYVPMPCRGVSDEVRKKYLKNKKEVRYNGHLVVHRFYLHKEGKRTLTRALRYMLLNFIFLWKGIITKTDVIFAQSTPPTQGMMAGLLSVLKKKPFVYNLQDIFPDSLVNSGMTSKESVVWKIGRVIENYGYRHATKIIVISEDFKKNIMKKGVPEEKIVVVPNWADVKGVYPVKRKDNILVERYELDPDKFYITYCGNIGFTQNMDMLLDVAKLVGTEMPDVRFLLIGEGAAKKGVVDRISAEKINNVITLPFQPYEDIAHVFSLGDVGLIISKPGVGNNSVPSKTWSIMAAGRPILASFDSDSELSKLIKSSKCGLCAEAGNKEQLIEQIRNFISSPEQRKNMGVNGKNYIENNLSKEKCVSEYIKVIEKAKE